MRAPLPFRFTSRAFRRSIAGFTLVELMVAMTGGLFLSIIVFALSRDASRFYQRESRVANATLAGLSGFERLSADVARAGHLGTPNIQQDPHVCNRPNGTWPLFLRNLRAIIIEPGAAPAGTELVAAGIAPQGIVISGALNTPEVLITSSIGPTGSGWALSLNLATPAADRLGLSALPAVNNTGVLTSIFMSGGVGHIVRLRANGMDQYAVVQGVTGAAGTALVALAAVPALQRLTAGGSQCGIDNLGGGYAVSVIDLVRYNIRSMVANANYSALFKASGISGGGGPPGLPYEGGRAELVRVEVDPSGAEIATTREIVGEYAVDLQVSAWGADNSLKPDLVRVAAASITDAYVNTQLLRGVHLRLSVRSREADRDGPIGVGGGSSDIYRIGLGALGAAPYARVRTFQSDVALRNLENSNW